MNTPEPPAIPMRLARQPTIGGLVVPWVTGRSPDGRYRFGAVDAHRHHHAIRDRRCQTCSQALDRGRVLFAMRDADLRRMISPEAGMHPECGRYAAIACPMLAGRMTHHHRRHPGKADATGVDYLGDPDDARPRRPRPAMAPPLGQRLPPDHRPGQRPGRSAAAARAPAAHPAHHNPPGPQPRR
jgi:hypothetical protein